MQTPYFTLYSKTLSQNYNFLEELCKKYLKDFKICYSVKTNSLPKILNILSKEKCNFEIASQNELSLINSFASFKVFNSPCKTEEEINEAKKQDCLINADSLSELNKLAKLGIKELGIRIVFSDSKFGIESTKVKEAVKYAESLGIKIICLHAHPGTQESIKDYEAFLKNFSDFLEKNKFKDVKYLDIGGGFPDKIQLKNLSLSLEDYFKLIRKYLPLEKTIILEPGRTIVSDSMSLITQVHYIKENFNKTYAILDAGINFLPKVTLSTYKFSKIEKENNKEKTEYFLAGPLLFSNDILGKFQGDLKEGDLIKVENVGAYCYNLSWTISYDKPKVVVS